MTTLTRYSGKLIALAAATCALSTTGYAAIVYDNAESANYLGKFFNAGREFGDQINLAGVERTVTQFKFEYYLSSASGNETAELRFYANDGENGAPKTQLWDSGTFTITTTTTGDQKGFNLVTVDNLNLDVANSFTWTVLFGGIDPWEASGLTIYDPPVVGSSYNDFWVKNATGGWDLNVLAGNQANFGAQVTAIPEPGTMALAFLGGLVWLGVAARRRQVS